MEDLGRLGRVWPEADVENSDRNTETRSLSSMPQSDGSRDVSEDIARELLRRCDLVGRNKPPEGVQDFVERCAGNSTQLTLRLVKPG
jgi:hypothetical protein